MKKTIVAVAAALMVMTLSNEAHSIGGFVSYWNGKDTGNGYGIGINHQIKFVPIVSVDVRASWLSFGDVEENLSHLGNTDLNVFPLEALARAKLGLFYVGAGVGYYIFDGKDLSYDNEWGGFMLGGVEVSVAKIGVFGELKYTWVESKIDGGANVDGNGIGVNAGVFFGL